MAQKTEFIKALAANLVIVLAPQSVCWGQHAGSLITVMTPAGTTHEMVHVPAGPFDMGSDGGDSDERPVHTVELDGYYIDKYEVANELYQVFLQATSGEQPRYASDNRVNGAQQPVLGVSWFDAKGYCGWAGLRLPTDAEWEKTARATDGRTYPWGEGIDADKTNYGNTVGRTTPVGSYPAGVSPYGAHDLAGNVWEWVADWYDSRYYGSSPTSNPTGPSSGSSRVIRGGSWSNTSEGLRASNRLWLGPMFRFLDIGFRCAQDEDKLPTAVTPQTWGEVKLRIGLADWRSGRRN